MHAYQAVIGKRSSIDLLGTNFDIEQGIYTDPIDVAPDEPADSFYEYLWGGWQMLHIEQSHAWYRMLTDALLKYKVTHVEGNLWFRQVDYRTGAPAGDSQITELASFYAELVAKGGDRAVGEAFYDSWTGVLDRYTLIPEVIDYQTLAIVDPAYGMRPEYPNSSFDLWFLTGDEKYRRTAYQYFAALRANCRVPNGYTVLKDVSTRPMTLGDHFPAYSFSENFKYLYLMFAEPPRFDPKIYYLNTEGKVLRGLRR
jgi:mannosyl-oligosaccharide alpha-1,2-mannosidase